MKKFASQSGRLLAAVLAASIALIGTSAEARRGEDGRRNGEGRRSEGGVHVNVDVNEQMMDVYVDGRLRHRWPVSTGRDGFDTPSGTYRPQRLEKQWFSKQYDGAPMPNAVFFHNGYAIHGTNDTRRLGRQASHGCVRLHPRAAAELFDLVEDHGSSHTRITIQND